MKWLVFIGGSQSHVPFLQAARDLNFQALVFDQRPCQDAIDLADEVRLVSCHNYFAVQSQCEMHRPMAGLLSYCSHPDALKVRTDLARFYSLPRLQCTDAGLIYNKAAWKRRLYQDEHIFTPPWCVVNGEASVVEFGEIFGESLFKPINGYAGSGISPAAVESVGAFGRDCIIEKKMDGAEYCINGWVRRPDFGILAALRKHDFRRYESTQLFGGAFNLVAKQVIDLLDLNDTFFSIDVISSGNKWWVIDVGILLDSGVDELLARNGKPPYRLLVQLCTGLEPQPYPQLEAGCS